jgi:FHS family L-fucose permease-like MFS transporter
MAIIGGAVFPAIMGYISDATNIRYAFLVPFACHLCVLYFAMRGYRPVCDARTMAELEGIRAEN